MLAPSCIEKAFDCQVVHGSNTVALAQQRKGRSMMIRLQPAMENQTRRHQETMVFTSKKTLGFSPASSSSNSGRIRLFL
jgi:hypothetical protein